MIMMTAAMATETTLRPRAKADAFLSKVELISRPRIQPKPIPKPVTEAEPKTTFEKVSVKVGDKEVKVIPFSEYKEDIKNRWKQIHAPELKDLGKDIKKGIDFTKPYVIKVVDWSKEVIKKIKERTST